MIGRGTLDELGIRRHGMKDCPRRISRFLESRASVRFTRQSELVECGDYMTLWTRERFLKKSIRHG